MWNGWMVGYYHLHTAAWINSRYGFFVFLSPNSLSSLTFCLHQLYWSNDRNALILEEKNPFGNKSKQLFICFASTELKSFFWEIYNHNWYVCKFGFTWFLPFKIDTFILYGMQSDYAMACSREKCRIILFYVYCDCVWLNVYYVFL